MLTDPPSPLPHWGSSLWYTPTHLPQLSECCKPRANDLGSRMLMEFSCLISPSCTVQLLITGEVKCKTQQLSPVQLFGTPWTVVHQAPLFMEFSRQEYWSGLSFPSPELANSYMKRCSTSLIITHTCSVTQLCPTLWASMDCSPPGSKQEY